MAWLVAGGDIPVSLAGYTHSNVFLSDGSPGFCTLFSSITFWWHLAFKYSTGKQLVPINYSLSHASQVLGSFPVSWETHRSFWRPIHSCISCIPSASGQSNTEHFSVFRHPQISYSRLLSPGSLRISSVANSVLNYCHTDKFEKVMDIKNHGRLWGRNGEGTILYHLRRQVGKYLQVFGSTTFVLHPRSPGDSSTPTRKVHRLLSTLDRVFFEI
ncbi:hypothetical protein R3P38DRAFT_894182 [Favolaschia claudopus]|uniref:Uncharacterized protein n=1 Tax=Favolaschia claudopus TaxID=2862362 RepID=A0AAW0BVG6_9AGAR